MSDPQMPLGGTIWFYTYFAGRGRELLAETLGVEDPFSLPGSEIVDRILAAGFTPDVEHGQRKPFALTGLVELVKHADQRFYVSINPDSEKITVQERRADRYEQGEPA